MLTSCRNVLSKSLTFLHSRHLSTSQACLRQHRPIKELLQIRDYPQENVTIQGWVKSIRPYKKMSFLEINDGSSFQNVQVVVSAQLLSSTSSQISVGCSIEISGVLEASKGKGQSVELQANEVTLVGACDAEEYPIKHRQSHSLDYLREIIHLRPRTRQLASLLRIRNAATVAFHEYYQENGYIQIHTPILTSNDCEGAGEVFLVEPHERIPSTSDEEHNSHFFNVPAFLSVSGQMHLEAAAGAFKNVYTFGPTFRAERSRGRHHLSEFYMIEGELAFIRKNEELVQAIEDLFRGVTQKVLDKAAEEVDWFCQLRDPESEEHPYTTLLRKPYIRLSYDEAIVILENAHEVFQFPVKWGKDLQKEHEQYLVKHCGDTPVFVVDFPEDLKPFYARLNDDGKTVASLDLLCADVGEVCGGTMREERLDLLQTKLEALKLVENYEWYSDLRRFGTVPHGGYGIGFERYLQSLLGVSNIKDTLPFPRYPRNCRM